ncbi:MAG: hypothetical protein DRI65_07555 [Chloroflexota bacterium]|nr:MAG: hypothetical protein DRI65_07555 [Chloroflexota bacterium]
MFYRINMVLLTLFILPVTAIASDDEWEFNITPYLWGSGLKGDIGTLPPAPVVEADISFSDIMDNLDMALMVGGEARKGRFGLIGDVIYMDIGAGGKTPGTSYGGVDLDFTLKHLALGGSYELTQSDDYELNALAGAYIWDLDNKLGFKTGTLPGQSISDDARWNDIFLGLKGKADINDKWSVNGWGMTAVAGDSDAAWDIYGGVGYRYSDLVSIVGGYRHLELDYDNGPFLFDVEMSGPVMGATFSF